MRAQNLTISVPYKGCDKDCPYCISKMTGYVDADESLFFGNMMKVSTLAYSAQVSSVLITGKGEPLLNPEACEFIGEAFAEFPIEIQTNGIKMMGRWDKDGNVIGSKFASVYAFSIDNISQWKYYAPMMRDIWDKWGIVVRVTLNMTDKIPITFTFEDAISLAHESKVSQLSFRNVMVPEQHVFTEECLNVMDWIKSHNCARSYELIVSDFKKAINDVGQGFIRDLPFGAKIFDIDGIAVTMFDECIQHANYSDDIRSLIYQEDGHLYTSWDSPASILF